MTALTKREEDRAVQLLTKMTHNELVVWLERMCMDACRQVTENIAARNGNRLTIVGATEHVAIFDPDQQVPIFMEDGRPAVAIWDGSQSTIATDRFDPVALHHMPPIAKATAVVRLRALADIIENGDTQ